MKIDENIDPKIVNDYSGTRKNESGMTDNKKMSSKEEFKKDNCLFALSPRA
jgi:hypothetical protein